MKTFLFTIVLIVSTLASAKQITLNIWTDVDQLSPGGFMCLQGCEVDGVNKLKEECKIKYQGILSGGAKAQASLSKKGFIVYGACVIEVSDQ